MKSIWRATGAVWAYKDFLGSIYFFQKLARLQVVPWARSKGVAGGGEGGEEEMVRNFVDAREKPTVFQFLNYLQSAYM